MCVQGTSRDWCDRKASSLRESSQSFTEEIGACTMDVHNSSTLDTSVPDTSMGKERWPAGEIVGSQTAAKGAGY